MLMLPCTQVRAFRPDGTAIKEVSAKYHAPMPVVVRAMVALWESCPDATRKEYLHKAATETLEDNAAEMQAIQDRPGLMCRNPTVTRVSR